MTGLEFITPEWTGNNLPFHFHYEVRERNCGGWWAYFIINSSTLLLTKKVFLTRKQAARVCEQHFNDIMKSVFEE